uniref:Uncharacterized protein n=1 Tax=Romanomermis culicivorax TaxID=13658 RepID=A0A915JVR3_ROMCU
KLAYLVEIWPQDPRKISTSRLPEKSILGSSGIAADEISELSYSSKKVCTSANKYPNFVRRQKFSSAHGKNITKENIARRQAFEESHSIRGIGEDILNLVEPYTQMLGPPKLEKMGKSSFFRSV